MSSLVRSSQAEGRLRVALLLTAAVLVVEVVGGVVSHSLALLSDAGHVVTDLVVLGLSAFALRQAARPVSARRTYGYHRVGILIALLNAVLLVGIVVAIVYEAIRRFRQPAQIDSGLMAAAAFVALLASLFIARSLQTVHADLTVRSALVHVWGDAGATGAAIVAAGVIAVTGWRTIDPLLSVLIAAMIAWSAWRVLWAAVEILLESTPAGLEPSSLVQALVGLPGIRDVHDLHVWSLNAQVRAMSAHLLIDDQRVTQAQEILDEVRELVAHRFNIEHTTIQFESEVCLPGQIYCVQPEGHPHLDEAHERLERRQASG